MLLVSSHVKLFMSSTITLKFWDSIWMHVQLLDTSLFASIPLCTVFLEIYNEHETLCFNIYDFNQVTI